jgi:hypothetical protein
MLQCRVELQRGNDLLDAEATYFQGPHFSFFFFFFKWLFETGLLCVALAVLELTL